MNLVKVYLLHRCLFNFQSRIGPRVQWQRYQVRKEAFPDSLANKQTSERLHCRMLPFLNHNLPAHIGREVAQGTPTVASSAEDRLWFMQ